MRKVIVPLFVSMAIVLLLSPSSAQDRQSIDLAVDVASFRYDDDQSYLELYYSFSRKALTFVQAGDAFGAEVEIRSVFTPVEDPDEPVSKAWSVPIQVRDTAAMTEFRMVGRVRYALDPDQYRVIVTGRDANTRTKVDSIAFSYEVPRYTTMSITFSDIQLATSIRQIPGDTSNIFYKNTLEVVPNPSALYGEENPLAYYYSELYNVPSEKFDVNVELVSSYGKTVQSKSYNREGPYDAKVEVGSVNIGALPTGAYTLNISYLSGGDVKVSETKKLFVFNPKIPFDTVAATRVAEEIAFEFADLSEGDIDERFAQAKYIATKEEKDLWDELRGSESKKKFLTRFWQQRDPNPSTPRNERYDEYRQRVEIANEEFRSAFKDGWKSDRGRVFILYGPPDNIERNTNLDTPSPPVIWRYDYIEGGVEFIFVDNQGVGNYILVHSTKQGEVYDPRWNINYRN
ncbi:MAG: hypothetical protein CL946_09935 [Ectothiorhodospiraceae bacterium]|nr:hypothetical protein [Ectothiorhodospiraceae bacterium]